MTKRGNWRAAVTRPLGRSLQQSHLEAVKAAFSLDTGTARVRAQGKKRLDLVTFGYALDAGARGYCETWEWTEQFFTVRRESGESCGGERKPGEVGIGGWGLMGLLALGAHNEGESSLMVWVQESCPRRQLATFPGFWCGGLSLLQLFAFQITFLLSYNSHVTLTHLEYNSVAPGIMHRVARPSFTRNVLERFHHPPPKKLGAVPPPTGFHIPLPSPWQTRAAFCLLPQFIIVHLPVSFSSLFCF